MEHTYRIYYTKSIFQYIKTRIYSLNKLSIMIEIRLKHVKHGITLFVFVSLIIKTYMITGIFFYGNVKI